MGLDVKTYGVTHTSRGYEKIYYSHIGGEQGGSQTGLFILSEGKGERLWVLLWLGVGLG